MNLAEFEVYLSCFNAQNYEKALCFFSDDMVLKFAGYDIAGKKTSLNFTGFFTITSAKKIIVRQFAGDNENVVIDVVVRLEGKKLLSRDMLEEKGFGRLGVPDKGEVLEIPNSFTTE